MRFSVQRGTWPARALGLVTSRAFVLLSFGGTLFILLVSVLLWLLERDLPPAEDGIRTFGDAVWWAFATATTVGYGDHVPQSAAGRLLGVLAMLGGAGLFACHTALFANALLGGEVGLIGFGIRRLREDAAAARRGADEEAVGVRRLDRLVRRLDRRLDAIERALGAAGPDGKKGVDGGRGGA